MYVCMYIYIYIKMDCVNIYVCEYVLTICVVMLR